MPGKADLIEIAALLPHCDTEGQVAKVQAVIDHGSMRKAAKALGIRPSAVTSTIAALKTRRAVKDRLAHMGVIQPDGYQIKGTSTLYDDEGNPRMQWVKTTADQRKQEEQLRAFVDALTEDIAGKSRKVPAPKAVESDLLTVYPMGDPHVGMYAWADEADEDFDLATAETDINAALARLVASSPASDTALILNLGDFFHADNSQNKTVRSGNVLDVDSRWAKVMQVGARLMVWNIEHALRKHNRVIVRNVIGNHDDHSSVSLSLILDAFFSGDDRVQVEVSPSPFWFLRWGKVLIGTTHGDGPKPADLPGIMAHDRAEDWGATRFRYWYTGHIHSKTRMEFPGCEWESFRNLAPNDAWHQREGYRSGRDMLCIVQHKDYGEIERHRADIHRVRASA